MVVTTVAEVAMHSFIIREIGGRSPAESTHKTQTNPPAFRLLTFVDVTVDVPMCRVTDNGSSICTIPAGSGAAAGGRARSTAGYRDGDRLGIVV